MPHRLGEKTLSSPELSDIGTRLQTVTRLTLDDISPPLKTPAGVLCFFSSSFPSLVLSHFQTRELPEYMRMFAASSPCLTVPSAWDALPCHVEETIFQDQA